MKTNLALIIDGKEVSLTSNKLIVGSSRSADILLDAPTVSHYQAMLIFSEDRVQVLDLQSTHGTFINGNRITSPVFAEENDHISFGNLHSSLIQTKTKQELGLLDIKLPDLPREDKIYIPKPSGINDILIDGEYCNIIFDDSSIHSSLDEINLAQAIDINAYIPTENLESSFAMLDSVGGNCIQVTTALRESILEQWYFPMGDGTISASPIQKTNTITVEVLEKELPLFKIQDGVINLLPNSGFEVLQDCENKLVTNKSFIITNGIYQVFLTQTEVPDNLLSISSFTRDKSFLTDTLKKFTAAMAPLLLLLFVNFTEDIPQPKKELSIIYKKPTNTKVDGQKLASKSVNSKTDNTGHKKTKQPDKKVTRSKSGAKSQPKKAIKVAQSKAAAKPQKKAKAKTKAYTFKMASNINSLFSKTKSASVSNSRSPSSVKTTSSVSGSLNTKVNGTSSNSVGNLGSDASGGALASAGAQGLSSKSGRDTSYIQTKTVVLGSMDPELLRKILRQYLPQFRHCYQKELTYNSEDIKGIVDLNFEISGGGKVGKIKVKAKDSRFSRKGLDCMSGVLAIIDFPKPKGGGKVAVRQPLSFFSEQSKG